MKPIVFGFVMAILVGCLCIGSVSAVESQDLVASGTVEADTISLTLPSNPTLTLTRGSDNIQGAGYATVTQTGTTQPWTLSVTGSNGGYMLAGSTQLAVPLQLSLIESPPTWASLTSGVSVTSAVYTGNVANIPLYFKQPVSISDVGGTYSITLTVTLTTS